MPLDPRTPEYWYEENRYLWDEISLIVADAMMSGVDGGIMLLPPELRLLINWDVLNQAALGYLHLYRLGAITDIGESTRTHAVQAISDWLQEGADLPALEARLIPLFDEGSRARRIAVTEVTRIYSEGNQMAWQSTGLVERKRWMTAVDDLVCEVCGELHGMEIPVYENFHLSEDRGFGHYVSGPPGHWNCRCWLQPVVTEVALEDELWRILNE